MQVSNITLSSTNLILASGSPRREEILNSAGFKFTVQASSIDEDLMDDGIEVAEVAVSLATAKASAIARQSRSTVVIGADTIVAMSGKQYGKPSDADDARLMLEELRGKSHAVITGVAIVAGENIISGHRSTLVNMRDYDVSEITNYITSGSPLDKAGSYGIQDESFMPAASIEGCYLNVVGLPLCLTGELMVSVGLITGADSPACPNHDGIPGLTP